MKNILFFIAAILSLSACENVMTRKWGGKMTVNLPCNQKLVTATWKEGDVWYLTRSATTADFPTTSSFREKSLYGVAEGQVDFVESRCD